MLSINNKTCPIPVFFRVLCVVQILGQNCDNINGRSKDPVRALAERNPITEESEKQTDKMSLITKQAVFTEKSSQHIEQGHGEVF